MSIDLKRVSYKAYSGIIINGTDPVAIPLGPKSVLHFYRAFYLSSQLEAPTWGTVQGYDGCGISAGPFHWIARYPGQNTQGTLFKFLDSLVGSAPKNANIIALLKEFTSVNWLLKDGILRNRITNGIVGGNEITSVISPINGVVPVSGVRRVQAEKWAILFHKVMSDSSLYEAQTQYAIDYLIKGYEAMERQIYSNLFQACISVDSSLQVGTAAGLTPEQDLAMCFYHTASVNAPGVAIKCLRSVINDSDFPRALIHAIGSVDYGQWRDNKSNTSRYDRARMAAMKSGLWDGSLFNSSGIMPENLI